MYLAILVLLATCCRHAFMRWGVAPPTCCRRSAETCLQVICSGRERIPTQPGLTYFGASVGFGRPPAAASMSEAFSPGLSNTPCWAWELSILAGAGGPSVFVPTGPGPGDDPVTAAPGATCPAPWAGRGSVARGEVWVEGCCARAWPAPTASTANSDAAATAESDDGLVMVFLHSTIGDMHATERFRSLLRVEATGAAGDQISRLPI